jgi:tRNA pseudouridine32 synthase/23S rRNA pseudouridine746 synthase
MLLSDCIIFIDAEAIVIDKPAGLPVDAPRRGGPSIVSRLDELRAGFKRPPTPMHRLDTDTSGCLLLARSPKSRAAFQRAFEAREVGKYYLAVVASEVSGEEGIIDLPLAKTSSAEAGWRMVADSKGQNAVTHWRRIAIRDGRTLVEFRPITGRTHKFARMPAKRSAAGSSATACTASPAGRCCSTHLAWSFRDRARRRST